MALTWCVGWAATGAVLAAVKVYVDSRTGATDSLSISMLAAIWGVVGFVTGGTFSVVLSIAERRRSLDSLKAARIAGWGALAGGVLPALYTLATANPPADIAVGAVLGAASAAASLWIARFSPDRAGRWSIGAGTDAARLPAPEL